MNERLFAERGSLFVLLCIILFAAVMSGLRFLMTGINDDFGYGFAVGLGVGAAIALIAVGWRRGELSSSAGE